MTKRKKFVFTSVLLTLGFLVVQFLEDQHRLLGISLLSLLSILLFVWSLREGLGKNTTLLSLILPPMFTVGVGLFWFLLPTVIYTRVPVLVFYAIGIYAICLTNNIFTVAAIRTIALARAAKSVGFVLTLITSFLIFDAIFSVRTDIVTHILLIVFVSFLLFFQGFWESDLNKSFSRQVFTQSLVSSLLVGQIAALLYFWPVTVVVGSVFLTASVYIFLGLGQAYIEGRLFKDTVKDYIILGVLVFVAMLFVTHWGG